MTCCASKKHVSCICKSQRTENMCQNFEKNMKTMHFMHFFDDKCPCLANQFEKSMFNTEKWNKNIGNKELLDHVLPFEAKIAISYFLMYGNDVFLLLKKCIGSFRTH